MSKEKISKNTTKNHKKDPTQHSNNKQIRVMYQNSLHPNSNTFISKPKTILCISNDLEQQIALRAKHLSLARKVKYLHSILQVLRFPVT